MTTTLKAIRRQMLQMVPYAATGGLGREIAVASLTTTTCVSTALAVGTLSSQKYAQRWLVRADAANTADRERLISAYASSTGTLTHAGTNYADTTAGTEVAEILFHEPIRYDYAIQETLRRTRRLVRTGIPVRQNTTRYYLGQLAPWVTSPSHISGVKFTRSKQISANRYFDHWNTVSSAGALEPDDWTLSGTSATWVRGTDTSRLRNTYRLAVTRSTNNVLVSQGIGILGNGVWGDSLRGRDICGVAVVDASAASVARLQLVTGGVTTSGSYHSGSDDPEELTVTTTVPAGATSLIFRCSIETTDGTYNIHEMYLLVDSTAPDDEDRRDVWGEYDIPYRVEQASGEIVIDVPQQGFPGRLILESYRPYPQFDSARVIAGTADADVSDAPPVLIATGAIARLYEGLAQTEDVQADMYGRMSKEWTRRFEQMALSHTAKTDKQEFGLPLPTSGFSSPARPR
jgi:hypothetical protein